MPNNKTPSKIVERIIKSSPCESVDLLYAENSPNPGASACVYLGCLSLPLSPQLTFVLTAVSGTAKTARYPHEPHFAHFNMPRS